jgi:hypothetical protein
LLHEDHNEDLKKNENTEQFNENCGNTKLAGSSGMQKVDVEGSNIEVNIPIVNKLLKNPIEFDMNSIYDNDYVNVKGDHNDWVEVNDNNDKGDKT